MNGLFDQGFAGATWLKRRMPARSFIDMHLGVYPGEAVSVNKIGTKNYGGPKKIVCPIDLPQAWFVEPGDGLVALRLLRAVLLGLQRVGKKYDLGPPPLRSTPADPGRPGLTNPFAPPQTRQPQYRAAAAALQEITDGAGPEHLVLVARDPASDRLRSGQASVARALGTPDTEQLLPTPHEEEIRACRIRQHT